MHLFAHPGITNTIRNWEIEMREVIFMEKKNNVTFLGYPFTIAASYFRAGSATLFLAIALILFFTGGCGGDSSGTPGYYGSSGANFESPSLQSVENLDVPGQPLRPGDWSRIKGSGFGDTQGAGHVQFTSDSGKSNARLHYAWGDREIIFRTPDDLHRTIDNTRTIKIIRIAVVHSSGNTSAAIQTTSDTTPNPNPQPTPPAPSPSPSPSPSPTASPVFRFVTQDVNSIDYRCGFSPDDKTIVFERSSVKDNPPVFHLQLVPAAGGSVTPLLSNFKQQSTRPNWSVASNGTCQYFWDSFPDEFTHSFPL
jgi:hypothetical protein